MPLSTLNSPEGWGGDVQPHRVQSPQKLLSRVRLSAAARTVATRLLRPWGFPGESTGVGAVSRWQMPLLLSVSRASLVAQWVKNLPAVRETWVRSLGWEDPLEKETVTHSSILAWEIP